MKKALCFFGVAFLGLHVGRCQERATIFQIGKPDGDYHEFAIAGNHGAYSSRFPKDVDFLAGRSDPARQWPFIQPGPNDTWAGGKPHAFRISFMMPRAIEGYYRLVLDFVSAHYASPPRLTIDVNGTVLKRQLPPGNSDEPLTHPKAGKPCSVQQLIPASLLHPGTNTITLLNAEGSWALYDDVRLESGVPAPAELVRVTAQGLPWFKRTPAGLRRAVRLSLENLAGQAVPAEAAWKLGGQSGAEKFDTRFGENEFYLNVAATEGTSPASLEITIRALGQEFKTTTSLKPTRKWRVFIVPTVHTDIGYTDLQERVMARHAENTLQALAMADKYPSFNWDFETFWQLDCFLRAYPEKTEAVLGRLREGRMGLSAFFGNLLTGLCSHEVLNRSTLDARNLATKGGFDFQSVILDDVPGAIGSVPAVLAHAGIKYFIEGVNNGRAAYATDGLPKVFYWEGQDGSRLLSHIAPGYAMAGGMISSIEQAAQQLPGFIARYENDAYPYDAILVNGVFADNLPVASWLPEVVQQWNAEWEYPKLILGRPEEFFHYLEQHFAAKIPVVKTDFGGWWEDGAGSSALETALCRRAEERAVTAEMLHAVTAVLGGAPYPKTELADLWRNILLYDEHTWGAACSVSEPKNEQTVKQWEVKSSFARNANAGSRQLLADGLSKLAALTPPADLVVFNSLSWARKGLVVIEGKPGALLDLALKRTVACQPLPEGGSCFIAPGLPSVGYRSYREVPSRQAGNAATISGNQLENEFYRVTLDSRTGALKSIYDKELKRELVDAQCSYGMGEVIYVTGVGDYSGLPAPKLTYHRPTAARFNASNGPVFGELASDAEAQQLPRITLRVRLYRGLKRLDLNYELDKAETTAKEAVYIAFPFAVDANAGGLWLEYPDAITEPLRDQHSSACRNWYSVQRWLAASDGQAAVVLSPLDTPLFTLGGMTAATWPRELKLHRGHVFAYVMNNYWFTNYKAQQGGRHLFRFSLTSHAGPLARATEVARGWEMFCPPVACRGSAPGIKSAKPLLTPPAQSLLTVDPPSLPLLACKQAEDGNGFILRAWDFSGGGGTLNLNLPKPAAELWTCDLVEANFKSQPVHGRTLTAPVKPFAPVTLKVRFSPPDQPR